MMKILEDFQLKGVTTFHLPSVAKYFCEYSTEEELTKLLQWDVLQKEKILQIGGGSNLVMVGDFDGAILHSNIKFIEKIEEGATYVVLRAGSGVVWDDFVSYCVNNGYYGAENMSFIPGEVGASAVQNIGSYGAEVKDIIERVHAISIVDCSRRTFTNEECRYGYRDSIFKNELKGKYIVTAVDYRLSLEEHYNLTYGPLKSLDKTNLSLRTIRDEIIRIRKEKLPDPAEIGSAGSFFKNPVVNMEKYEELRNQYPEIPSYFVDNNNVKIPAGWLIEHSGLKGKRIGGVIVYPRQCLILANMGGATGEDVVTLCNLVVDTVNNTFGIELFPEANII